MIWQNLLQMQPVMVKTFRLWEASRRISLEEASFLDCCLTFIHTFSVPSLHPQGWPDSTAGIRDFHHLRDSHTFG